MCADTTTRADSRTESSIIGDLAGRTPSSRNRAIDAYRALAMLAVALGHWLVIAVAVDDATGDVVARNALEVAPRFSFLTWPFQVMPLFFAVGGYASRRSIRAHRRRGGSDADWLVQRLRRLVAPTAVLAATWLVALVVATVLGAGGLAAAGMVGAAIPLWFLANYTIDTALAPTVSTALERSRTQTVAALVGIFATVEVLHRVGDVPWVEHVNWVVGWLLFQMIGMLWSDLERDGHLPSQRRLAVAAGALWCVAIATCARPKSTSPVDGGCVG
ncbi:MAG: acyltransferase, partial [Actinomycetota bacterium]